jgi:glycosyltransferase involved in cell wall biosynthesis
MTRVMMLVFNDMTRDARVEREATALVEAGYAVTVAALRSPGIPDREERDGYEIRRVAEHTTASWKRPAAKLQQARARERDLVQAIVEAAPAVVHAHDLDALPSGVKGAAQTRAKLVYDSGELFADMLVANRASVSPAVLRYWNSLERRLAPRADAVITVSDGIARELNRRLGVDPVVVRNCPPLEPLPSASPLREALGVGPDSFVVLYQGLVNIGRGLSQTVRAIALVPGSVLAIQGYGPLVERVLAEAEDVGVADRVRYLGRAPIEELNAYAAGADVGDVVLENLSLNNYLAAPNKLFQYMMAGIPVLASDFPEMKEIVEGERVGLTCDPASAEAIAAAIRSLRDDPEGRKAMGRRARGLAESRYNWDAEKDKLLEVYERLGRR